MTEKKHNGKAPVEPQSPTKRHKKIAVLANNAAHEARAKELVKRHAPILRGLSKR